MRIHRSKRVIPLPVNRQITQNILVRFQLKTVCNVVVHLQIQSKKVNRTHHQKGNIILVIQLHLHFRLVIDEIRQKWQSQNRKQALQITLPRRKDISGFFTHRTVRRKSHVAATQSKAIFGLVGVAIHLSKVQHTAQSIRKVHRESTRVKVHFFDEIHVEQTHRTARTALCLKVIDDGNLDPV